jgi:hypothetical protein
MQERPIIIDAGPLYTYLAVRYLESIRAEKAKRIAVLERIRDGRNFTEIQQELLCEAMTQPVVTTPHVMTEVLRAARESSPIIRTEDFRDHSIQILVGGSIREEPCPIERPMCRKGFSIAYPPLWACRRGLGRHCLEAAGARVDR